MRYIIITLLISLSVSTVTFAPEVIIKDPQQPVETEDICPYVSCTTENDETKCIVVIKSCEGAPPPEQLDVKAPGHTVEIVLLLALGISILLGITRLRR